MVTFTLMFAYAVTAVTLADTNNGTQDSFLNNGIENEFENGVSIGKRSLAESTLYSCKSWQRYEKLNKALDLDERPVLIDQDNRAQWFYVVDCLDCGIRCIGSDRTRYSSRCVQGRSNIMAHVYVSEESRETRFIPIQVNSRCYCKMQERAV